MAAGDKSRDALRDPESLVVANLQSMGCTP